MLIIDTKIMKQADSELSNIQKFIALTVVFLLFIGGMFLLSLIGKGDASDSNFGGTCETRFDSTACPEPDYEQSAVSEERAIPEATSIDDHPDNCGGYSCKQLEQEAQQEMIENDRQMDADLRARGLQ